MIPPVLLLLVCALLTALAGSLVAVSTDAGAILPRESAGLSNLDTSVGRGFVVALGSPDRAARTQSARDVAELLADNPMIALVSKGPITISEKFLDWAWNNRFRLALPEPNDLTVAGLSHHLAQARTSLSGADGFLFGDRLLRDPTGSFERLLHRFLNAAPNLRHYDGIWQSLDDRAALLFVELADRPFETAEIATLADRIRARAADGVTVRLLGPRIVSAEIGQETARESTRVSLLAGALLLAWLLWTLRSTRALALSILPLACGLAAACLAVQLLFGSIHVIALGFGGVLAGLALDYPVHLLSHTGTARPDAERLVLLGALTTSAGFLAMLGSGVPALMQTGLFVAVGLSVAAVTSRVIPVAEFCKLRSPPVERLAWRMPFRASLETIMIVAGIAALAGVPADKPGMLFELPERFKEASAEIGRMVALPSGRYAVSIEGSDLTELLRREAAVQEVLDAAVAAGQIDRYTMLARSIPPMATIPGVTRELPDPLVFQQRAAAALRDNGMVPEFASTLAADYRVARNAPVIGLDNLEGFAETRALAAQIHVTPTGLREVVRLYGARDPVALAGSIAAQGIPGVRAVDLAAPIEAAIRDLRRNMMLWLGIGLFSALVVLLLAYADWRRAVAVARTTGAAVGLTALLLTLFGGPLGVFEIAALTLLFGIGIDYGLFLARAKTEAARVSDFRSVGLCAASTLVGFSMMVISSVKLLHEIGTTVILGVVLLVALHFSNSARELKH